MISASEHRRQCNANDNDGPGEDREPSGGERPMPRPLRPAIILVSLSIVGVIALRSWVVVDETRYVVVTEFGRIVADYGDQPGESGLHAKWPWQSAIEIDR